MSQGFSEYAYYPLSGIAVFTLLLVPLWSLIELLFEKRLARSKIFWAAVIVAVWGPGSWCYGFFQSGSRRLRRASLASFLGALAAAGLFTMLPQNQRDEMIARLQSRSDDVAARIYAFLPDSTRPERRTSLDAMKEELSRTTPPRYRSDRDGAGGGTLALDEDQSDRIVPVSRRAPENGALSGIVDSLSDGRPAARSRSPFTRALTVLTNEVAAGSRAVVKIRKSHTEIKLTEPGNPSEELKQVDREIEKSIQTLSKAVERAKVEIAPLQQSRKLCSGETVAGIRAALDDSNAAYCDQTRDRMVEIATTLKNTRDALESAWPRILMRRKTAVSNSFVTGPSAQLEYRNPWDRKTMNGW